MNEINLIQKEPLVRTVKHVLTNEICNELIEYCNLKLVPGEVLSNYNGDSIIDKTHRSASVANYEIASLPHLNEIKNIVSNITGIDSNRFEKPTIINYKVGEQFKCHQDYFIQSPGNKKLNKSVSKRCEKGGNRTGTIIIYLNESFKGGETHFPWLDIIIKPETGMMCEFKYDYDNYLTNLKTQHSGLPIIEGEKWILTFWVREQPLDTEVVSYKKFLKESKILNSIEDIEYSLDCGPKNDIRTMKITLPANDSPLNGILVGVTGGVESTLLLYFITVLNTYQKIPYQIIPVMVATKKVRNKLSITENVKAVEILIEYLNRKIAHSKIRNLKIHDAVTNNEIPSYIQTLQDLFLNGHKKFDYTRFVNFKYIFIGDNELPTFNSHLIQRAIPLRRYKVDEPYLMQPFFNLQKYHILDMYIKLDLMNFFLSIGKCSLNHKSLDEHCQFFACEERRFSFIELGKSELGNKYLI